VCSRWVRIKFIAQREPGQCAVACLRMAASGYGMDLSETEVETLCKAEKTGIRIDDLANGACEAGMAARLSEGVPPTIDCLHECVIAYVYHPKIRPGARVSTHAVIIRAWDREVTYWDPQLHINEVPMEQKVPEDVFLEGWRLVRYACVIIRLDQ
jgi:ABC-type bacteriocin/lantibiotic exporter with double-glycine peptidase domain